MSLKIKLLDKCTEKQYTNFGIVVFGLATILVDLLLKTGGTGGFSILVVGVIFNLFDTIAVMVKHFVSKKS